MTTVPLELPNTAGVEAPAVLLPYQQRWVADRSPFKVARKSRRTGLTWAEAADNVLTAAGRGVPLDVFYMANQVYIARQVVTK